MRELLSILIYSVVCWSAAPAAAQVYLPDELEVKFHEGNMIRLRSGKPENIGSTAALKSSNSILLLANLQHRNMTWSRSMSGIAETKVDALCAARGRSKKGVKLPDLNLYFRIKVPDHEDLDAVADALRALEEVEAVYRIPAAEPPPALMDYSVSNNVSGSWQKYLDAAPLGIDARYAWEQGYNGSGVKVCDIEYDWNENHHDLPSITMVSGTSLFDYYGDEHGTAVNGELHGLNNSTGVLGIAHGSSPYFAGAHTAGGSYNVANGIMSAAAVLSTGDVILIEQQMTGPNGNGKYVPVEWYKPTYDAIVAAVANGITVVEAAGNGSENLDDAIYSTDHNGHYPFVATNDSGAIIVGAGQPPSYATPRARLSFSTYGSTVDLQGYGRLVVTTGYGDLHSSTNNANEDYTSTFDGTSSASPIVAGAVAVIQQAYKSIQGTYATPQQIKELLQSTGTPQQGADIIGPLPDLRAAIIAIISVNDADSDGWYDWQDNCPTNANADQADVDLDGLGDVCDPDLDGDDLPDDWEFLYFGSVTNSDAEGDNDQDSLMNRDEWTAGTHPNNSNSYFRISNLAAGSFHVSVLSESGRLYSLYYTHSLFDSEWKPVIGATNVAGTGSVLQMNDSISTPQRKYRVSVRME